MSTPDSLPPVPGPAAPHEPLLTVGTVTAFVVALLALVATFVDIDDDTQSAILALVAVLAPFVVALVGRGKVFAPATVHEMVVASGRGRSVAPPSPADY